MKIVTLFKTPTPKSQVLPRLMCEEEAQDKSKFEFSKLIVIISLSIAFICVIWFFILTTLQMETGNMYMVVNELIKDIVYVAVVYFLYNGFLKNSRNKYGIDVAGVPYAVQEKYRSVFGSTPPCEESESTVTTTTTVTENTNGETEKPIG